MAKGSTTFELFIVSVDFDTTRRRAPYYKLKTLLETLGGVLAPTHQVRLLLTPLSASQIRNKIRSSLLRAGDRIYVGKIAKGSAWYKLLKNFERQPEEHIEGVGQGCDTRQDGHCSSTPRIVGPSASELADACKLKNGP